MAIDITQAAIASANQPQSGKTSKFKVFMIILLILLFFTFIILWILPDKYNTAPDTLSITNSGTSQ